MYIRHPIVAGTFYPNEPQLLKETIEGFLHQATVEKFSTQPKAIIVPHAGYIYSGQVAAYGFKILENYEYEKIFLLGPSHHFSFEGLALSPSGYWETPLGKVECLGKGDLKELINNKEIIESSEIHEPEHCLEVEIPFLQIMLKNFKIIPCLTGELDIKKSAKAINNIFNKRTLLVVSSDLSHYHSYDEARKLDKVTLDAILDQDQERLDSFGEACGKTSIKILIELAKKNNWQPKLLKALNSGDITGDKTQVVGYASIAFFNPL